jgi:hypothetical protein
LGGQRQPSSQPAVGVPVQIKGLVVPAIINQALDNIRCNTLLANEYLASKDIWFGGRLVYGEPSTDPSVPTPELELSQQEIATDVFAMVLQMAGHMDLQLVNKSGKAVIINALDTALHGSTIFVDADGIALSAYKKIYMVAPNIVADTKTLTIGAGSIDSLQDTIGIRIPATAPTSAGGEPSSWRALVWDPSLSAFAIRDAATFSSNSRGDLQGARTGTLDAPSLLTATIGNMGDEIRITDPLRITDSLYAHGLMATGLETLMHLRGTLYQNLPRGGLVHRGRVFLGDLPYGLAIDENGVDIWSTSPDALPILSITDDIITARRHVIVGANFTLNDTRGDPRVTFDQATNTITYRALNNKLFILNLGLLPTVTTSMPVLIDEALSVTGQITAAYAEFVDVIITGSLSATSAYISTDLQARNIICSGTLSAASATLRGALSAGTFSAASATITGTLSAAGATITGALNAAGATLSGALSAASATLSGALNAASATITGALSADTFSAASATITGAISATSAAIANNLSAASATITGTLSAIVFVTGTTTIDQSGIAGTTALTFKSTGANDARISTAPTGDVVLEAGADMALSSKLSMGVGSGSAVLEYSARDSTGALDLSYSRTATDTILATNDTSLVTNTVDKITALTRSTADGSVELRHQYTSPHKIGISVSEITLAHDDTRLSSNLLFANPDGVSKVVFKVSANVDMTTAYTATANSCRIIYLANVSSSAITVTGVLGTDLTIAPFRVAGFIYVESAWMAMN